ncbi:MAG TPA: HD-GYP domain-containing protein [Solirubrobacteraceae bacterium]|nr:HD-GYP domain-containing protein [Solirubrobacteraceae bacterium]
MTVEQDQLHRELVELRVQLGVARERAAQAERQLERYANDQSESSKSKDAAADELRMSYRATVRTLSNAVEARDAYTGKHAERVAAYGLEIAAAAGLPIAETPEIEFGFLLHDIGKVAIPDSILFKPQALSNAERQLMQRHTVIGFEILEEIEFLGAGKAVVRSHHERWDGSGYPDGLAGEKISLAARVFAVADALDALTSNRPYRHAASLESARAEIVRNSGSQFDPAVVAAFANVSDQRIEQIRREVG